IALLAKTLDRLPGVDIFKRHLIDPKIVLADHVELDFTETEAVIQKPLDNLRRIRIFKADWLKDKVILEPFCHISRLHMDDDTRFRVVLTAYVVAQQPVKYRHEIRRLAPVRADRRLDQDFVVTVEKRAIAIRRRQLIPPEISDITPTQVSDIAPLRWFLHEIERRSFHSRRDAVEPFAVEQGEIQRRDGIVVRMRSEEHTSELQSREKLVCRLLLEKKKT